MNQTLRQDAETIVRNAIAAVKPDEAVRRALMGFECPGRLFLVAVGKAGWRMAKAALESLHQPIEAGIVVTKYGHVEGALHKTRCFEAGHPVPDENSFQATSEILALTEGLLPTDTVLFLLSGGGSALFEQPLVSAGELRDITGQLLAGGADIVEINTIRKRLSAVKGGRFAVHLAPARVEGIVLSDILGDPLDMIASGPVTKDSSTSAQALEIAEKYNLTLSMEARDCLMKETPKEIQNARVQVIGSVRELCRAAAVECEKLGYETFLLTDRLDCEAKEAGRFIAAMLRTYAGQKRRLAFLAGGETIVHVNGSGLGGRNQELALSAASGISGIEQAAVISVGSDGTDGPTDAAGGYVDGDTKDALAMAGVSIDAVLKENDAYHALKTVDGLIITGSTGTNVNDVTVGLLS